MRKGGVGGGGGGGLGPQSLCTNNGPTRCPPPHYPRFHVSHSGSRPPLPGGGGYFGLGAALWSGGEGGAPLPKKKKASTGLRQGPTPWAVPCQGPHCPREAARSRGRSSGPVRFARHKRQPEGRGWGQAHSKRMAYSV